MAVTATYEPASPPGPRAVGRQADTDAVPRGATGDDATGQIGAALTDDSLTQAVVERIEDGLATVLVGRQEEEWAFPAHLLPAEAEEGSMLILEGSGRNFRIIGIGAGPDGVQERLARSLNRRRPIVFPLPHREIPIPVPATELPDRPSRMARGLGHDSKDR